MNFKKYSEYSDSVNFLFFLINFPFIFHCLFTVSLTYHGLEPYSSTPSSVVPTFYH